MSAAKRIETISLEEAIHLADVFFCMDAKRHGHAYKKSYLYNLLCAGKLTRHGPPHKAHLDKDEFLSWLESKKKS